MREKNAHGRRLTKYQVMSLLDLVSSLAFTLFHCYTLATTYQSLATFLKWQVADAHNTMAALGMTANKTDPYPNINPKP